MEHDYTQNWVNKMTMLVMAMVMVTWMVCFVGHSLFVSVVVFDTQYYNCW